MRNAEDRRLASMVRKRKMRDVNEEKEDVEYWMSRPARERIEAVTFLVSQCDGFEKGVDRSLVYKGERDSIHS